MSFSLLDLGVLTLEQILPISWVIEVVERTSFTS